MKPLASLLGFTFLLLSHIAHGQTSVVSGYGLEPERQAIGERITFEASEIALHTVLRQVAQLAGKRLALEHGLILNSPVNLRLEKVPWDLAIDPLLSSRRLQAHLVDDVIVIVRARGTEPATTGQPVLQTAAKSPSKSAPTPTDESLTLDACSTPVEYTAGMTKPKKIRSPQPQYTKAARRQGLQGWVTLKGVIDCHGNMTGLTVEQGLALGLSESAIDAVSKWRFKPATLDGKPVAINYTVTVPFRLR